MLIVLANSKGGVGKSTLAVHLAVALHERGRQVTLVDADVQSSSSQWMAECDAAIPVRRFCTPDEVLEGIKPLQGEFEFVVADGPAGLSEVTRALLLVADLALLPCGPSALDLRSVREAVRVVRQAQSIRGGPPRAALVPNKLQVNYRLSRELLDGLAVFDLPVLDGLRLRQAYPDAAGQGTVVWRLPDAGPAAAEMHHLLDQILDHASQTPPPSRARPNL